MSLLRSLRWLTHQEETLVHQLQKVRHSNNEIVITKLIGESVNGGLNDLQPLGSHDRHLIGLRFGDLFDHPLIATILDLIQPPIPIVFSGVLSNSREALDVMATTEFP